MKLIFTITGRGQWYLSEPGKPVVQIESRVATSLMENGTPVDYR